MENTKGMLLSGPDYKFEVCLVSDPTMSEAILEIKKSGKELEHIYLSGASWRALVCAKGRIEAMHPSLTARRRKTGGRRHGSKNKPKKSVVRVAVSGALAVEGAVSGEVAVVVDGKEIESGEVPVVSDLSAVSEVVQIKSECGVTEEEREFESLLAVEREIAEEREIEMLMSVERALGTGNEIVVSKEESETSTDHNATMDGSAKKKRSRASAPSQKTSRAAAECKASPCSNEVPLTASKKSVLEQHAPLEASGYSGIISSKGDIILPRQRVAYVRQVGVIEGDCVAGGGMPAQGDDGIVVGRPRAKKRQHETVATGTSTEPQVKKIAK